MSYTPASALSVPSVGWPMAAGRFYEVTRNDNNTVTQTLNQEIAFGWVPTRTCTLTDIRIIARAAGVASAAIRFGIRQDSGGMPGTLLTDFGSTDLSAATNNGTYGPTGLTQAVTANTLYWLTATMQGATIALQAATRQFLVFAGARNAANIPNGSGIVGWRQLSVSGALPGTWTNDSEVSANAGIQMFVSAAS